MFLSAPVNGAKGGDASRSAGSNIAGALQQLPHTGRPPLAILICTQSSVGKTFLDPV